VRIGATLKQHAPLDDIEGQLAAIHGAGLQTAWCSQTFGFDTLALLGLVGRAVPAIELGTAVVPVFPRHPLVLARQALTTQAATDGRLVLGIGPSHAPSMEGIFGLPFERPATQMREYLEILMPVLHGRDVELRGEFISVSTASIHALRGEHYSQPTQDHPGNPPLDAPGATPPPVLVGALGPRMLELAGALTDGVITWLVGPEVLESTIIPAVTRAASRASRPPPRIVVGNRLWMTDAPDEARREITRSAAVYGDLPSYRAMLDRQGARGHGDVALVGNEEAIAREVRRLGDVGATDFAATIVGPPDDQARAVAMLGSLVHAK
jgi:F420-dependent oxidoreductase-like protein